jgi:hypothetical protein
LRELPTVAKPATGVGNEIGLAPSADPDLVPQQIRLGFDTALARLLNQRRGAWPRAVRN